MQRKIKVNQQGKEIARNEICRKMKFAGK